MKLVPKFVLGILVASSGVLVGGSASALSLPGWAGMPDPMSEVNCWVQSYGRLTYASSVCGDNTIYDEFDIAIPTKQANGVDFLTVSWQAGADCSGTPPICIGEMAVRRLTFNADGTFSSSSTWNGASGTQSAPTFTPPANATVQLDVRARGTTNSAWISRVFTSGSLSL